jgi:hypothetical protein
VARLCAGVVLVSRRKIEVKWLRSGMRAAQPANFGERRFAVTRRWRERDSNSWSHPETDYRLRRGTSPLDDPGQDAHDLDRRASRVACRMRNPSYNTRAFAARAQADQQNRKVSGVTA